jgi:hypothetical protein
MGHTNSTANLALPQFIGTDKPTWLSDVNGAFAAIDTYAGNNDAALAITDAKADTAVNDAASAVTTATNAANTAGTASTQATNAVTVAGNALTVANGINSKVGVLTDLHTTDKSTVVNAINEVFDAQAAPTAAQVSYDNTVSGLTATDVQAAIDEIAGGGGVGAWTLAGSETGTTAISIPAGATELNIICSIDGTNSIIPMQLVVASLTNGATYRAGYYGTAGSCGVFTIDYSGTAMTLSYAALNGGVVTNSAVTTIYYR